ncbi:MAG: lipid IV(A) palmitoyltransferase PagP [Candidatus Cloacimonetes bacterium]|nr:lipid IV(A) palmitoyltransferase PagP [Candidatus Cloacimonadota bacterium]
MNIKNKNSPLPHLNNVFLSLFSIKIYIFIFIFYPKISTASEVDKSILEKFTNNISETFKHSSYNNFLFPLYMWHNRLLYDQHKTDRYNEIPLGAGFSISRETDKNVEHSLFTIAFTDSNHKIQLNTGYIWQKIWYNETLNWHISLGYTAHIIQRYEYLYIPIPIALPLGGLGYKNIILESVYFPGPYNDGNVLFVWFRYKRRD